MLLVEQNRDSFRLTLLPTFQMSKCKLQLLPVHVFFQMLQGFVGHYNYLLVHLFVCITDAAESG